MKGSCSVDTLYVSCACNRTPHCLDWGGNDLICYGACNAVAIYDTKFAGAGKVVQTLCGHKGLVNGVCWARRKDGSPETDLVSVSADSTVRVWSGDGGRTSHFSPAATLSGHEQSVVLVDAVYEDGSCGLVIVTASVDSSLKVWRRLEAEIFCTQTIALDPGLCLSLRLNFLPGTEIPFLAYSTDDAKIHLLSEGPAVAEGDSSSSVDRKHFVEVGCLSGHEDWVRALDFVIDDVGDMLLASAAQDNTIRLWRISQNQTADASTEGESGILQTEGKKFSVHVDTKELVFTYSLESVLSGHEGWVYGIAWFPQNCSGDGSGARKPLQLLSCSLDKTMILWQLHGQSGVWLESARLGEVGGNTLGFYGAKVSPSGLDVIGHGYQGSLHLWHKSQDGTSWVPGVVVGGHFGPVTDLCWEPGGQYLLSVGADQTTRLHAPWVRDGSPVTWHEIARPQVHGYDMACLAILSRHSFASGAEEKVIRAFQAPHNFIHNFQRLCGIDDSTSPGSESTLPRGASVPALGLSNKAVYGSQEILAEDRHVRDEFPEAYFVPVELTEPPTEEALLQNTLWPEVQKLYGHGYELYSLAARPDGRMLASACRATTPEHAAILLWDTRTWQCVGKLASHQLTVTQMAFSPDGDALLSVSRDRRWSLFHRQPLGDKYELVASTDRKTGVHSRIVWCCAWAPDSRYFATGSRDGIVVVWPGDQVAGGVGPTGQPLRLGSQSVTAITFWQDAAGYVLAVGLDAGDIYLYRWLPPGEWNRCLYLDNSTAHHLTVKRLAFRPGAGLASDTGLAVHLASCGCDNTVKIYSIPLSVLCT